jgi:uncharacterized protein YdaU (DUF1376 family)
MTLPWYRRFPDRFIAGTVGMTLEEKGAYSLVLDLMYVRYGPIPDEPRYIAGVCNCSVRKWNAIRKRLIDLGKIHVVDGYLVNFRAEEEIEIGRKISEEAAEKGAKGGIKSAEIRATAKKNNALAQAGRKLSTSISHKEGATRSDPTDGLVDVSKYIEPELFAECVKLTEPVKAFVEHKHFPASIVDRARTNLSRAREQVM